MILMNDFKAEPTELRAAMLESMERVLKSGWYVLGNEVVAFEKQWADRCGVAHAVGVGNGMDALEIALRALNIGQGDEVITTPMTAFATVLAIFRSGATPVLADIDPHSALLSIQSVERCLSPKTKAVVLVHLYGQLRQMDAWVSFTHQSHISLIEDCAQAHFASWEGKSAGSFGVAGAYSFYPTKNLGAPGDAGILITDHQAMAERASQLRNYGQSERYLHPILGMNSRLDELQATVLTERLKWLPEWTRCRRHIADRYRAEIANPLIQQLSKPEEVGAHVYHLYVVTCKQRDALQAHLLAHQVQSLIHYPVPVHQQDPCLKINRDPAGLNGSELHACTCLSLPCHPQMTDDDIGTVISVVNLFR